MENSLWYLTEPIEGMKIDRKELANPKTGNELANILCTYSKNGISYGHPEIHFGVQFDQNVPYGWPDKVSGWESPRLIKEFNTNNNNDHDDHAETFPMSEAEIENFFDEKEENPDWIGDASNARSAEHWAWAVGNSSDLRSRNGTRWLDFKQELGWLFR